LTDEELKEQIERLIKSVDDLIDEVYRENTLEMVDNPEFFIGLDWKSYDEICKYLDTKKITLMGIA
tara:strand:+ start:25 stop:222 length:198 start_codon:yes stop_codon:yes gene_type:complete